MWERAVRDSTAYPDAWLGPAISRATVRAVDKALTEAREELDHVSADLIDAVAERDELRREIRSAVIAPRRNVTRQWRQNVAGGWDIAECEAGPR